VLESQPRHHLARLGLARCQYELDLVDDAIAGFRAVMSERPNDPVAYVELAAIGAADAEVLARAAALAGSGEMPPPTRRGLLHAAARIAEDLGRFDDAFAHAASAKAYLQLPLQPDDPAASVNRLIATFDDAFFTAKLGHGDPSVRPVFVVGVPRAGTAIVARLLASHPQIAVAGELPRIGQLTSAMAEIMTLAQRYPEGARELTPEAIQRLARRHLETLDNTSPVAGRVVDAMPANFEHLGLIATLFPNARILHCRRDPLDLALSCYLHAFPDAGARVHEPEQIAAFLHEHDRLMSHWRRVLPVPVHEIVYEELAAAPEAELRRLVGLLGLLWDDRCLSAVADGSVPRTLLSRDPVGRWQRFDKQLGALRQALGGS
jgi:hypothetical protein